MGDTLNDNNITDIDLDDIFWKQIKTAAMESQWMPVDYMMDDWVSDVCTFLRVGQKCD